MPTILNFAKNLLMNKKFNAEFFKKFRLHHNRQQTLTENTGQDLSRNYSTSFERIKFKRQARKDKTRLAKNTSNSIRETAV